MIYASFSWSVAQEAYEHMRKLAVKYDVGFFDASEENGDIIFALNIDGENKMLPNSIVKEKYPKDLFAFYESKITIVPYPEIQFTLSNST